MTEVEIPYFIDAKLLVQWIAKNAEWVAEING